MAGRSRQQFTKRQKERARQEKKRQKAEKRAERKAAKEKPRADGADDPDIAGIVPGPQPLPWDEAGLTVDEEEIEREDESVTEE